MRVLNGVLVLLGRVLIAGIFLWDALTIARGWEGAVRYGAAFGIPPLLVGAAAVLQAVASVLVILGLLTRPAALALAVFCVSTALIFHINILVSAEQLHFGKDLAMAGGFLFLAALGAGRYALDGLWRLDGWSPRRAQAARSTMS